MARLSCKPGTIVAIPLTDGRFAFAKVFADSMLGVYDWVSPSVPPLVQVLGQAFAFHQATTLVAITRGDWPPWGLSPSHAKTTPGHLIRARSGQMDHGWAQAVSPGAGPQRVPR